ncbi:murein hydrolase activator EnvC family protein [Patescibacteria group bacterium]
MRQRDDIQKTSLKKAPILFGKKRNFYTFIAVAGLAIMLVVGGFVTAPRLQASSINDLTNDINSLTDDVSALEAEIAALQANIAGKQMEIRTLANEISILDQTIGRLRLQIQATEKKIELTTAEIDRLKLEIRSTEEELAQQQESLIEFIRELYVLDQVSPLQALLANQSLSEFLDQSQQLQSIQARVREVLEQIKEKRLALETKRRSEIAKQDDLTKLKGDLDLQRHNEENSRKAKNDLLARTKGEENQYQTLLAASQRKQDEIYSTIGALEDELRQQQALLNIDLNAPNPIPGLLDWPSGGIITQEYGWTPFAQSGAYGGNPHNGMDISAGYGSSIKSAANGEVVARGSNGNYAYGNWVAIRHTFANNFSLVTLYAHMISYREVNVGQHVSQGQTIGHEGSTGYSTGPHLHFGVYTQFATSSQSYGLLPYGITVNPRNYL